MHVKTLSPSKNHVTVLKNGQKAKPFFPPLLQTKLDIGPSDDPYEREAERVADQILRVSNEEMVQAKAAPMQVQKKCAACESEERLHRKQDPQRIHSAEHLNSGLSISRKCASCEKEESIQRKDCTDPTAVHLGKSDTISIPDYLTGGGSAGICSEMKVEPADDHLCPESVHEHVHRSDETTCPSTIIAKPCFGESTFTPGKNNPGCPEKTSKSAFYDRHTINVSGESVLHEYKNRNPKKLKNCKLVCDQVYYGKNEQDILGHFKITYEFLAGKRDGKNVTDIKATKEQLSEDTIRRKCEACEHEEKEIQRKNASDDSAPGVTPAVEKTLQAPGHPMDAGIRSFMEKRFGYDFNKVQIHNDTDAHRSAKDINALAYTHGNHVVFGAGQYRPDTNAGKRLLAHELTHVLQQNAPGIQTAGIQMDKGKVIVESVKAVGPYDTLKGRLDSAQNLASNAERVIILDGSLLQVYDAKDRKNEVALDESRITLDAQKVYDFNYSVYKDQVFTSSHYPFLVFLFDTTLFKIVPNFGYAHPDDSLFTSQEINEIFNVPNWFISKTDEDDFRKSLERKKTILLIFPEKYQAPIKKDKSDKKTTTPPAVEELRKQLEQYKDDLKATEPGSVDLPDKIGLYNDPKEGKWKIRAYQLDKKKKMVHLVFVDITPSISREKTMDQVRKSIRDEIVKDDQGTVTIDGEKKSIDTKFSWAFEWLKGMEKLIADERRAAPGDVANLPDKISLSGAADQPDSIYLTISVFVSSQPTIAEIHKIEQDIENIKKYTDDTSYATTTGMETTLKSGTIPMALNPMVGPNIFFPVVREYAYSLRHANPEHKTDQPTPDRQHPQIIEAFKHAFIKPLDVRSDFQSVRGGSHRFRMDIDVTPEEGNTPESALVFFSPIHYQWRIYSVNDLFKDHPENLKEFSEDWQIRRVQLMDYFKTRAQVNAKPLLNEKAMAERKAVLQRTLPNADLSKLKEIFYGDSGLDPVGEFSLPDATGDYMIFCLAQWEDTDKFIRLPSEAFFPIRLREGFDLADTALENNKDKNLATLEQQLKDAKDDKTKEELKRKIKEYTSRTLRDQTDKSKPGSKITAINENIRIANLLNDIYQKYHTDDELQFEFKLAEYKKDYKGLIDLWSHLKRQSGYFANNLAKYIEDQNALITGINDLHGRITKFDKNIDYTKPVYTPNIVFISDETGQEYQLITLLGLEINPDFPHLNIARVTLIDVSTEDTQKRYYSDDYLTEDSDLSDFGKAAVQAINDFAETCKYGEGYIAYSINGLPGISGRIRGKCSTSQKVKNFLGKLALVAGIAALVLGTVASGGLLGGAAVAFTVIGVGLGAALSLYNISDRIANHRFHADIEFALDVINIVAPFAMGAAAALRLAKLGLITEGIEGAGLNALKGLIRLEKGIVFYQKFEMATNLVLTNYKLCDDLDKINAMHIPEEQKDVLRRNLIYNGLLSNMMFGHSLAGEFRPEAGGNKMLNDLILGQGNVESYKTANIKSGIYDADGNFNTGLADQYHLPPGEATLKPSAGETQESAPTERKKAMEAEREKIPGKEPPAAPEPKIEITEGPHRTLQLNKKGHCEVCASPCPILIEKYKAEIEASKASGGRDFLKEINAIENDKSLSDEQVLEKLKPIEQDLANIREGKTTSPAAPKDQSKATEEEKEPGKKDSTPDKTAASEKDKPPNEPDLEKQEIDAAKELEKLKTANQEQIDLLDKESKENREAIKALETQMGFKKKRIDKLRRDASQIKISNKATAEARETVDRLTTDEEKAEIDSARRAKVPEWSIQEKVLSKKADEVQSRELDPLEAARDKIVARETNVQRTSDKLKGVVKIPERAGGSYIVVKKTAPEGGEVHHSASVAAYEKITGLSYNDGPSIYMSKADHAETASHGSSDEALAFQAQQRELILKGDFQGAVDLDVADIRKKFPDGRYEKGIIQMLRYLKDIKNPERLKPK